MTALLVALAGGLGAVARLVLDGAVTSRTGGRYPAGTFLVNVAGSLLLGLVVGLAAGALLPWRWELVAGTGFLGGFTTFSTAAVETIRLAGARRWVAAVAHALGMIAVSVLAAGAGLVVGMSMVG